MAHVTKSSARIVRRVGAPANIRAPSFRRQDDGNLLSYELACIMVAQLGRDWAAFEQFARTARRADAGAAAAREHLQLDLGAYASLIVEREPSAGWTSAVAASAAQA